MKIAIDKEKLKEYQRRYRQEHKEQFREYARRYYKKHAERLREYTRRYKHEHRREVNKRRNGEALPRNSSSLIKPIGSEKINCHGYVIVKVNESNKWRLKHHLVYEEYYGERLGECDKVMFLDGNKINFNPENLVKVSNSEQVCLESNKLIGGNTELNRSAVTLAKLIVAAKNKGKNKL